jgi:hypothetical protein
MRRLKLSVCGEMAQIKAAKGGVLGLYKRQQEVVYWSYIMAWFDWQGICWLCVVLELATLTTIAKLKGLEAF